MVDTVFCNTEQKCFHKQEWWR